MNEKLGNFELNKIYCMDCLEGMKKIPDDSIDLVVTDPPYNASNFKREFKGKNYQPINEVWDSGFVLDKYSVEFKRILKNNGSVLLFCSFHTISDFIINLRKTFKIQQILHWVKLNPMPSNSNTYTYSVEYIIWGTLGKNYWGSTKKYDKGNGYVFNKSKAKTDVFKYPIVSGRERTSHPTQKPLLLIKQLLEVHSNPNDTLLDPFMGSGTTAVACKQLGRKFLGFEINPEYVKIANRRLEQQVLI